MYLKSDALCKEMDKLLSPHAVKNSECKGRVHKEQKDELRTPFQVDTSRIKHSKAFRRLKGKTQVFTPSTGDHFRDRLTHTLEVAQISRGVARSLRLNEDLAEAIALAHDLGHTPFGHAGEHALEECMEEYGLKFEHNEQSKRIVEKLESPYPNFKGLNLTTETLEGLQKHQTPFDQVNQKFVSASLEAQIVNIADEIAYVNADLDDGLRSSILKIEDIEKLELWQEGVQAVKERYTDLDPIEYRHRYLSAMYKIMINDLLEQSDPEADLIEFSPLVRAKIDALRKLLYEQFYMSETVLHQTRRGQEIIRALFHFYYDNQDKLPDDYHEQIASGKNPVIIVKDYIAGMTDKFARSKYEEYALS